MREGDLLAATRLDRVSRSTNDLLEIASELQEKNVAPEVREQSINTTTPEGKLFSTMVAAFAELNHSLTAARPKDGVAAARARGRIGGRKPNSRKRRRKQSAT